MSLSVSSEMEMVHLTSNEFVSFKCVDKRSDRVLCQSVRTETTFGGVEYLTTHTLTRAPILMNTNKEYWSWMTVTNLSLLYELYTNYVSIFFLIMKKVNIMSSIRTLL